MALSLTAEQQDLLTIFNIEQQYVIPPYQRPYSWEYDHCFQLYNDLIDAYNSKDDYFIGNIIIAKNDLNKDVLEVIDGQQRLTTLLLLLKVLNVFQPELVVLDKVLKRYSWDGQDVTHRIKSDIFEAGDGKDLDSVLSYTKESFEKKFSECSNSKGIIIEKKCKNTFERNILYFYSWFSFYIKKHGNIGEFTKYLLQNVHLLPIKLTGKTPEEASEKALIIFETINNRGMNLEDADIFKAKLYQKARKVNEEEIFIESWVSFKNGCNDLSLDIDDIFRYYSHIIRGKNGTTSNEISLREFFTNRDDSPFVIKQYQEILDDLFQIIEILNFITTETSRKSELSIWLQVVNLYTNQYPKYALVTYLFVNGNNPDIELIETIKSIIRYVYYEGSTSRVKFELYKIIKQISSGFQIDSYCIETKIEDFYYLGRLKYGFALLAFYLTQNKALSSYRIDKLINLKDKGGLPHTWEEVDLSDIVDRLGNFMVLDIPKKNISFIKKISFYKKSSLKEAQTLLTENFSYEDFKKRDLELKERLVNFFEG